MQNNFIAFLGVAISSLGFATDQNSPKQPTIEDLQREIQVQCGQYSDLAEYEMCVQIVEMDVALVPQGCSGSSGTGTEI